MLYIYLALFTQQFLCKLKQKDPDAPVPDNKEEPTLRTSVSDIETHAAHARADIYKAVKSALTSSVHKTRKQSQHDVSVTAGNGAAT